MKKALTFFAIIALLLALGGPAFAASQYMPDLKVGTLSGVSSFSIDDSSMAFGTDGAGGDVIIYTENTGDNVTFDEDNAEVLFTDVDIQLDDDADLIVGTGGDFTVDSDTAATLDVTPLATDESAIVNLGADTTGIDLKLFGAGTGNYLLFDASDESLNLVDISLKVDSGIDMNSTAITESLIDAETVTAANVLTAAESGKVSFLASTSEFQTTLPAISTVSAGWSHTFIVVSAPSGASYTIITGNSLENVLVGGCVERETDTGDDGPYLADADTITLVDGVSVKGDRIDIVSDGSYFYVTGQVNADGALTITQAD